ncbi:MAG: sugar transferase [Proteobacteria bacterium]|nr:sugar transferase [Pseudomonadota bacterium]MBU4117566.1 sugar transferase [Pseudomonadota bacterium]
MHFWRNKKLTQAIMALDLVLVGASFIFAYWVKKYMATPFQGLATQPNYYIVLSLLLIASFYTFKTLIPYTPCNQERFLKKASHILLANLSALGLLIVALYILHIQNVSRIFLFLSCALATALIITRHLVMLHMTSKCTHMLDKGIKILVVGTKERAKETIKSIYDNHDNLYTVVGCLDLNGEKVGKRVYRDVMVIGEMNDFKHILLNQVIDEVIFAIPLRRIPNASEHISFAEKLGVEIRIIPDWQLQKIMFRPETASISFEDFMGMPTLCLSSTPKKDLDIMVKGVMDFTLSLAGLIVLSPILLLISLAIKIGSDGPVFFKQIRCGINGRHFEVYKFSTMVEDAELLKSQLSSANEMDGPVFKIKDDPRVTTVGKFLRKTSLDELPQLFNVLKGEMSLVGPRPPLPEEVEAYLPHQRRRLSMKPGITCIWQVSGRNKIGFEQWMKLDLKYIDNWSLWLDCKLLALTVRAVVRGTGH